jgi:uncharacterized membrane protein YedE/YeeE
VPTIVNFTPVPAFVGGALIGLSAVLVLLINGKIAGISGVFGRLFSPTTTDRAWRAWFVLGLLAGGLLVTKALPDLGAFQLEAGWPRLAAGAFLVGLGTRLGGGCTSGHGVCGASRGSVRSMVATAVFMAAGFVTVFVTHHVLNGGAL